MSSFRFALTVSATLSVALAAGWEQKAGFELLFNQGYYSANWQGSEQTSGALTTSVTHQAARRLSRTLRLEHDLGLAFGQQVRQRDSAAGGGWEISKSEDRIRLDEVLRFTLGAWIDPLFGVQLKSQFTDTRDTNTLFINPLQLIETFGAGRKFYDDLTRALSTEIGAAARQEWDARESLAFTADAGLSWNSLFKTIVFTPNAGYVTRLTVYKPFVVLSGAAGIWPQVDWDHELSARFNKALSGKVYVQILFDEKVHERPRLKQTLGMGLSLAWPSN